MKRDIEQSFQEKFASLPKLIVRSPGRINLIGEHTDYNNGFVLPAAINKAVYIGITPREDNAIHLFSIDNQETHIAATDKLQPSGLLWPDYMLGVVDELQKIGKTIKGFNAIVTGNVPIGAGLSSSAALECAVAFALNEVFQLGLERLDLVKISQKAENNFVGMQCGIMDQFASMMGKEGQVIKLDCGSLDYEYFPLKLDGYKVLLLDTQVKHSLASSEYNTRRKECAEGVRTIQQKYPEVQSLRDATVAMIEELIVDETIANRCRFVVEENERLLTGCIDLEQGNVRAFGQKMFTTHHGLSKLYEVSCPELDFFVEEAKSEPAVIGARMMGGGFGGCTINIVEEEAIEAVVERMMSAYQEKFGTTLKYYIASIEDGTSIVE